MPTATFNQYDTSKQRSRLHVKDGACAICALVTTRCHQNRESDLCAYRARKTLIKREKRESRLKQFSNEIIIK